MIPVLHYVTPTSKSPAIRAADDCVRVFVPVDLHCNFTSFPQMLYNRILPLSNTDLAVNYTQVLRALSSR